VLQSEWAFAMSDRSQVCSFYKNSARLIIRRLLFFSVSGGEYVVF
jgi:hypothetical protein